MRLVRSGLSILCCVVFLMSDSQANQPPSAYQMGLSTYLSHMDKYFAGYDVFVDERGFLYASGNTRDRNVPATPGAYDTTFNGEKDWAGDVYLVKLNPSGSGIVFSTFLGGSGPETAHAVIVDPQGNILVGGTTESPDFPTTAGAVKRTPGGRDGFVARFGPNGDRLLSSTLFGGDQREDVVGFAADDDGNVYMSGVTQSANLPVTKNAVRKQLEETRDAAFEQGLDHFLAKLNRDATEVLYCSYFAGNGSVVSGLQRAPPNRLIMAGNVNKENLPVSEHAVSPSLFTLGELVWNARTPGKSHP